MNEMGCTDSSAIPYQVLEHRNDGNTRKISTRVQSHEVTMLLLSYSHRNQMPAVSVLRNNLDPLPVQQAIEHDSLHQHRI